MTLYAGYTMPGTVRCDPSRGKVGLDTRNGYGMLYGTDWGFQVYFYDNPEGEVDITARPAAGYRFKEWRYGGSTGEIFSTSKDTVFCPGGHETAYAVFEEDPSAPGEYEIELYANPYDAGTVTGAGIHDGGTTLTVKAVPEPGYEFVKWTEYSYDFVNFQDVYTDVSTSAEYSFTVDSDRVLTAEFSAKEPTYYTVTFNSYGGGNIPSQNVEEGKKLTRPDDPVLDGWHFTGWYLDESMDREFNFSNGIDREMTLYAGYSCSLSLRAESESAGTVGLDTGHGMDYSGSWGANAYFYSAPEYYTIEAKPETGFVFKEWIDVAGGEVYSTKSKLKIDVPFGDLTLLAVFEKAGTASLKGDVDLDGSVGSADLTMLARHVAQIAEITDQTAKANADADGDGEISSSDLTKLARFVAHIIDEL